MVDESYRRDIFALENDAVFDVVGVTTTSTVTTVLVVPVHGAIHEVWRTDQKI